MCAQSKLDPTRSGTCSSGSIVTSFKKKKEKKKKRSRIFLNI